MESGEIVEYIDDRKIICAVVMESGNQKLRLLTEHNREVKMAAQRLSHRGKSRLDCPREETGWWRPFGICP
jgi:exoribonuclease-2